MDIVERLRNGDTTVKINSDGSIKYIKDEAAEEIERLREALRKIGESDVCVSLTSMPPQCARAYQARAALKEKE